MATADQGAGRAESVARLAGACRRDAAVRARLAAEPRTVLAEFGIAVAGDDAARAAAGQILAAAGGHGAEELTDADLAALAAGFFMKIDMAFDAYM
jgi:hypothetical protein